MGRVTTAQWFLGTAAVFAVALASVSWYGYARVEELAGQTRDLSTQLALLESTLSSTTENLKTDIAVSHSTLSEALSQEKQNVATKLGSVEQTVGTISGSVSTLEKLSKTDPELLAKYSKVFFLSENYAPARLVEIPDTNAYYDGEHMQILPQVLTYLQSMFAAAAVDGVTLYVYSAYRSFGTQEALKGQYTVVYGAGTANQFSADQGYSEHQLGTTVDLITTGIGGVLDSFRGTTAYQWLLSNAYRWGFILSYPQGNSYYIFEPWHWRFVGVKLATDLRSQGKYFYDLDQRTIDEYLASLFD